MPRLCILLLTVIVVATGCAGERGSKEQRVGPVAEEKTIEPLMGAVYNVRDFGAYGDGMMVVTDSIQAAIDRAAAAGGGLVYFPPGTYVSGTLVLRDSVTLHLETGARLLGSPNLAHYPEHWPEMRSYTDNYVKQSLIYAEKASNIAITGRGTIDGHGSRFTDPAYLVRPYLIRLVECTNVKLHDVTLQNSAMWVTHLLACDNVDVRGLHVESQANRNNDMLDIDCCRNVRVSDCYANTGDDCIVLKSTSDRITENVTITNCVLSSQCNAIKLGTESNGGFRNITISNCAINSDYRERKGVLDRETGTSGVSLEMVDGGVLENITITNLTIRNVLVPIFLRLGNRARPFSDDMDRPGVGHFRNVVISNIVADDVSLIGCSITGLPGRRIRNVTLSNIRINFPGGGTAEHAAGEVHEHAAKYPEATMFGVLPAWGFYCRHVEGLRFHNVDMTARRGEMRPVMVFEDVSRLDLIGVTEAKHGGGTAPMLLMRDVREAMMVGCRPDSLSRTFLRVEGSGSDCINVMSNDLRQVEKKFEIGPGGLSPSVIYQRANP